jgi:hypothetical protein
LSKNAFASTYWQIVRHFARYCNLAWFSGVLELPVTAFLGYLDPAIVFQQSNGIPNLHVMLSGFGLSLGLFRLGFLMSIA